MAGVEMTWVHRAVELAEQNAAAGQLPFGAVVVRAGEELATGVNTALRDHDPAAHAEVEAVRNACRALGVLHLTGAVIYSSCEPCDMCRAVATNAGISTDLVRGPRRGHPGPALSGAAGDRSPDPVEHTPADGSSAPFERYLDDDKLGLNVPTSARPRRRGEMRGWVRFAQDGGFALAMVSDHVAPTPDVAELYPPPFYDPFTTLAWLAGDADGLELGTP